MKNKIEIRNWGDVSIAQYRSILSICNDEELSGPEKDIALIALLTEIPESEVWNMPVEEVRLLRAQVAFVTTTIPDKDVSRLKTIKIGDYECEVTKDLQKFTMSQYVDFQTYIKDIEKNRSEMLSTFIIPNGRKYNEGYDIDGLIKGIETSIDIVTASSLLRFFVNSSVHSMRVSAKSLALTMKMKALVTRNRELRRKYREMAKALKEVSVFSFG